MNGKTVHGPYLVSSPELGALPRQINIFVHVESDDIFE